VQDQSGRTIGFQDAAGILAHPGHFRLIYNKRKHLCRAVLKPRMHATALLTNKGRHYAQHLSNGYVVHALRGAP